MRIIRTLNVMILLLSLSTVVLAEGERFFGKQVSYSDQALEASFANYDVFQLDITAINNYVKSFGAEPFEMALVLDNQYFWDLSMMVYDIRGEDYREMTITEHGQVTLPRRPCITYSGVMNNDVEKELRMSITSYGMMGYVFMNGEEVFIEPVARLVNGAPLDYFIVYKGSEVLIDPSVTCGKDMMEQHSAPIKDDLGLDENDRSATLNCTEVDFALAAAYDMYTKYGNSVANVADHLLTITSMMEPLYDDFDLDYIVRAIFVPSTPGSDPFPTTSDVDVILPSFSAWGPAGFGVTHDVGQLWVARNIFGCGSGTGLIGCANIGVVCNSGRYNVCEDWSTNFNCLRALSAHELGHNWDGVHSQAPASNYIMWPTIGCNNAIWGAGNITRINNHINSRICLTNCATACPLAYSIRDYIISGTWKYEAAWFITGTGHVDGSAVVTFDAGISVTLAPGFETNLSGGTFIARTDGCGGILLHPELANEPIAKSDVETSAPDLSEGFSVYPNPFNNNLTVEYEIVEASAIQVRLYDAVGKELLVVEDNALAESGSYIKQLNVANLAAGAYFVSIMVNENIQIKKVIKLE